VPNRLTGLKKTVRHYNPSLYGDSPEPIEVFLTEYDAYTQREYHSETDIRVLATLIE